jgi:hypothetical protein
MGEFFLDDNLGQPCIYDIIIGKRILAKGLDMEPDRGGDVSHGIFVRVAFANNNSLHPDRIGHKTIRVFLDNDLEGLHESLPLLYFIGAGK